MTNLTSEFGLENPANTIFADFEPIDLHSPRMHDLLRKGLREPRRVTIAEVYELCISISAFLSGTPRQKAEKFYPDE